MKTIIYNNQLITVSAEVKDFLQQDDQRLESQDRRDRRRLSQYISVDDINETISSSDLSLDEIIETAELSEIFQSHINKLTKTERKRIILHFALGCSQEKIAAIEDANQSNISRSINSGIKKIKNKIKKF